MTAPTVTLSGPALRGVDAPPSALLGLPQQVRLGRRPPRPGTMALRFADYHDAAAAAGSLPPASTNWRQKAAASTARVYLNDTYGDCVIAGKAHALGVWSGNDADGGGLVLATDQEIYAQYQSVCGPGDNGCVITDVLDYMRSSGFVAGGKRYKIDGYVAGDWTNKLEVQVVLALFGCATIGINLPDAWTKNDVWDVTGTQIVGGHDVTCVDYDDRGVYVASWGRVYLITWAAFTSRRWVEEFYAILAPLWYNADGLAPSGVDAARLRADLAQLGGGSVPDPGPGPAPPPPPPTPPPPPPVPPPAPPGPLPLFTVRVRKTRKGGLVAFLAPVAVPAGTYAFVPAAGAGVPHVDEKPPREPRAPRKKK